MDAILLCLTLFAVHDGDDALRGCALAPHVAEASESHGHDPRVVMAIGWVETRWKPWLIGSSGERGALQVLPRFSGLRPAELSQASVGVWAGAGALARWRKRASGNLRRSVQAYNAGNAGLKGLAGIEYADQVLALSRRY